MYCPACGVEMQEQAVFCSRCGARASSPPAKKAVPPPISSVYAQPAPLDDSILKRPTIITLLAVLKFIATGFYFILAVVIGVVAAKQSDATAYIVPFVLVVFSILYLICGIGLVRMRNYGRILQVVFASFGLLFFPVGTVISILILIYIFKPEIKLLFSGKALQELTPSETGMLSRFAQSSASGPTVAIIAAVAALFIIGMIGIISAIAIPNFLNAVQRGKQKRSMADIRAIGTACEAFAVDNNRYPSANTIPELASELEPTYIQKLPRTDGWEREFRYSGFDDQGDGYQQYAIASSGKDGIFEHDDLQEYPGGAVVHFNNDIVFSNGSFVQYPEMTVR